MKNFNFFEVKDFFFGQIAGAHKF